MVAGKVRQAMGLQKSTSSSSTSSPANNPKREPPPSPSPSYTNNSGSKVSFSRSFGVYFPRSGSAQVQPRPPDVTDLLRLVEDLRERESRLKTEILEHKLLKESVAIVPVLEQQIATKNHDIERSGRKISSLESENERLKREIKEMKVKLEEVKRDNEEKMKNMEAEISELKKTSDELSSSQRFQGLVEVSVRSNLIKNLKRGGGLTNISKCTDAANASASDLKREEEVAVVVAAMESESPRHSRCNSEELTESTLSNLRSRAPRVPKPPPKRSSPVMSSDSSSDSKENRVPPLPPPLPTLHPPSMLPDTAAKPVVPPPPPPPLPRGMKAVAAKVRRVPEVVEFYHSLMRRDSRRDSGAGVADVVPATANARDMIGEIENRSSHLLAIKTDVETQGDFIRFLIKEVENAAFTDIEDVVPFVKWLDDELSYLVDERAVLKHFDWPEKKADALREAAFGYGDLKKLESEASISRDDARQPCGPSLKKMQALLEKLEHGVYNLSRMRESATKRYKGFQIPSNWMLETGIVSQIKLASVKLARKYMKRVSAELENVGGGPEEEELIVQGVRFAFRVHQFAGGFDVETMRAFQELRDKARSCYVQGQNQNQQKFLCRSSTTC
ncbi:hypothetical protein CFOL_v3_14568 [Cephalotus follicularis]|uniref:Uncharacterized protein n=1 Tax=Cephalotus follicularis TaxID=3775 RepID=A0A1Q3BT07_CEPFO|nr:hypothetical protein CFOL_v3_14568 [Cephalotus follicularis]